MRILLFLYLMSVATATNAAARVATTKQQAAVSFSASSAATLVVDFLWDKKHVTCLTGAGVSTDSGIPDYRGINGSYKKGHKPMIHTDFMKKMSSRKRYWARSLGGWKTFSRSAPNPTHFALSQLEAAGHIQYLITQNVDRLHQSAGSIKVCDLHGRNDRVKCQSCHLSTSRRLFQSQVAQMNTKAVEAIRQAQLNDESLRADGDAEIENCVELDAFKVPSCPKCGGILKPDVVFFGDNVPKARVEECYDHVDKSDGMLIVGTSLEVFSAFRFAKRAVERGIPIVLINQGETRLDRTHPNELLHRIDENSSLVLEETVMLLKNKS